MRDQIDFDERIAGQLEVVYRTRDIKRRRALAQEALDPQPGDEVLDVGCGPGFYVADILDIVGQNGAVTGVDASAAMLAIAGRKAGDRPNVRLLQGEATKLPVGEASVDRAISVQVFESPSDVDAALSARPSAPCSASTPRSSAASATKSATSSATCPTRPTTRAPTP